MDLALNNIQRLICHKTQTTNLYYKSFFFLGSSLKTTDDATSKISTIPFFRSL